jgi:hypothetical protein
MHAGNEQSRFWYVVFVLTLLLFPQWMKGQATTAGTSINFPAGFPDNTTSLTLNGGAVFHNNALRLTNGGLQEASSAFYSTPVGLASFHTEFDFQLTGKDGEPPEADGFTFIVQSLGLDALGSPGAGLGYGNPSRLIPGPSITKGVGVKFDLHNNEGEGPSSTGLVYDGFPPTVPAISTLPQIDLHSGHVFHVALDYMQDNIFLTITDKTTGAVFGDFFYTTIGGLLGSPVAYAGFTAATGDKTAIQNILNWTLTSSVCCLAGEPSFPAGFSNASDLVLNGSAEIADGALELVENTAFEVGSAYYSTPIDVNAFTSDFDFRISRGYGEGFTFVIQSQGPHALGSGGGGLGYGPALPGGGGNRIKPSVALKFDLHSDDGEGSNSTGLYENGASPTSPYINLAPAGINLHAGHSFHVHLLYAGSTLTATITDLTQFKVWTQEFPVDLRKLLGTATAWFGFTASTGELFDSVQIRDWTMSSYNPNEYP